MKTRIIVAAVCLPFVFIVLFFLPPYILTALVALVCAISAYELLHAIGAKSNDRIVIYSAFSATLIPVGVYFDVATLVFPAVFLCLMSLLFVEAILGYRTKKQVTFAQILIALFAGTLIPYMLSSLIILKLMPEGRLIVLLPVISAFLTDAGAYFTGMLIGKRKAFPLVSPKKTVEGFIGGLITGPVVLLIYGLILFFYTLHEVRFAMLILYGVIGAVVTELGDLSFSFIKREYNIKDYGRLIPGNGGMLDRFDSMVFTAPAMYLLMSVIPAIIVR